MNHMKLLDLAAVALLAVTLTACTSFAPVYGGGAGGGASALRFNFAPPDNRLEQIILDRLKLAFPGPATAADPTLDIAATASTPSGVMSNAIIVGKPINVRVEAVVTIVRDSTPIFSATRFSDTAYQGEKLTPVDLASRSGALETAARSVAEAVRAAILTAAPR